MPIVPPENTAKICSICNQPYSEWGNNAWPITKGRCCNACNDLYVIPRRIHDMRKTEEKPPEEKKEE